MPIMADNPLDPMQVESLEIGGTYNRDPTEIPRRIKSETYDLFTDLN
jgi:hypothetical protein